MKTNTTIRTSPTVLSTLLLIASAAPLTTRGAGYTTPERFGVINIVPNVMSGESYPNSEPSIAVGTGPNYGKVVVHAFSGNYYFTSANSGGPPWISPNTVSDSDATMDWSTGGTCYLAVLGTSLTTMSVLKSSDPATVPFSLLPSSLVVGLPDQPWIRVVNVAGQDHIFVGWNDHTQPNGSAASIRYSMDSGSIWNNIVLERAAPSAGPDAPGVRLAISPDGGTIYGLFQRWTAGSGADALGDVVLMRDDGQGLAGYNALGENGTLVAHNVVLPVPGDGLLGAQRIGDECDVAVSPVWRAKVYVAYTEVAPNGTLALRVKASQDGGATFTLVYTVVNACHPSLAVAADGTVGLLYAMLNGGNIEIHFAKAPGGAFSPNPPVRILAVWPNNNPPIQTVVYFGDYIQLRAVGYNFFGAFSASNEPNPSHFPSSVYYQRNVKVNGTVTSNFVLSSPGSLVDLADQPVANSIDPFVFYDIAPNYKPPGPGVTGPTTHLISGDMFDPVDPLSGVMHLGWPALPENQPQFELFTAPSLGQGAPWTAAPSNTIIQANGAFQASVGGSQPKQFYLLKQSLNGAQFNLFASADGNGTLSPTGTVSVAAGQSQTFTAAPASDYAFASWYLDGVLVPSSGPSLTVTNIQDEHTVVATFIASNDLAVTLTEFPAVDGPTLSYSSNSYIINVENQGLNTLTGVSLTNVLDPTLTFLSATTTQGTVNNSGSLVTADLGSLDPGVQATVTISCLTGGSGSITDIVGVVCDQPEPNLENNTATVVTVVYDTVTITNQPVSQIIPVGGTASFSVGAAGTPPLLYQWFFNGLVLPGETNDTLTISNATLAQAGVYSVTVIQAQGPEFDVEADSEPATLTVVVPGPPIATTLPAYNIYPTTAGLYGMLDPSTADTTWYFEFGTDTNYGSATGTQVLFALSGPQQVYISSGSGLTPSTTYHVQLVASNSFGVAYGGDLSFNTPAVPPGPLLQTFAATAVSSNSAVLTGSINPNGSFALARFQWGLTTGYGSNTANFYSPSPYNLTYYFTNSLVGLAPNTTYHFRAIGYNSNPGAPEGLGNDVVFTTSAPFQQPPPTVQTLAATSVGNYSAVLNGNVNGQGDPSTSAYFEWGTDTNYGTITTQVGVGGSSQPFNAPLPGLAPNTTYHYRMDAANTGGSAQGADQSFTTGAPAQPSPTVQTLSASSITSTGAYFNATFNATVNPNGADTHAYFQYGLDINYGNITFQRDVGSNIIAAPFNSEVGLAAATTYHFRVAAYNASGTSYGEDVSFTTPGSQAPPIVTTLAASSITTHSALLNANVNPNGADTYAYFEYGLYTNYGNTTVANFVGSNLTFRAFSGVTPTNLAAATTYYYRVVAYNSAGISYGAPDYFTSLPFPPSVTTQAGSIYADTATFNGTVNPNSGLTTAYFEYGLTPSYGSRTSSLTNLLGYSNLNFTITASVNGQQNYYFRAVASNPGGTAYGQTSFVPGVPH